MQFPPPESADETGLVAITPTLSQALLLNAYRQGIFPWSDHPVRWYSPDPRAIFIGERVHLPSNLKKLARRAQLSVTQDTCFEQVMRACAKAHADDGVWISPTFIEAYCELHASGYAHSVEVWQKEELVGGLYGVQIAGLFAGESMFHRVSNASKVAFAALLAQLRAMDNMLIDAQVLNPHTAALGAVLVRRAHYLERLKDALQHRPATTARWPTVGPDWTAG